MLYCRNLFSLFLAGWIFAPAVLLAEESPERPKETIAILGTGDMGDSFGPRLASLGYTIIYGSRDPDSEKVAALVRETGNGASAATSDVAARQADIVLLALPWEPIQGVLESTGGLAGKTVIDLTWPASEVADDGFWEMTTRPSGAEVIQSWIPDAMVVKAFGTTASNIIDDPDSAGGAVSIPIASDYRQAKEVTARLAAELGLDPVDAGPLRMARNIEAMMELYLVPHVQGREAGWEFYFRRSNYWSCNSYTGSEDVEGGLTEEQLANLADFPETQPPLAPCVNETDPMATRIAAQQKSPDRHEWDFRRDAARRPYEVFRFLGLEEGMVALDVGAYAGYTTEMLAAAVGPAGKVYSHNTETVLKTYADGYYDRTMAERLANDRLPNVVMHLREYDDLGLDGEVDLAFLGNLLHDFYNRDGEENALAFLASIHEALKPGGVLGVMDHVGIAGRDNKALHRMTPQLARDLLIRSGFEIEAESDMFANADDDHSLMVYSDEIYLQTDRFLFRARKPVQ